MVTDSAKKVSRVVTRGFTKRVFSSAVSHGVSFDVTGNNDSIEDSSTDDDEFVTVSTKKRRVTSSGISALDKKAFHRKIDTLVQKNEKSHTAKENLHISLTQANKKVKSLEARLRTLNKNLRKSEAAVLHLKTEETRLLLSNRTLKKLSEKHQKDTRHYLFLINKQERSVVSTEKKKDRDFRALEVKSDNVMHDNKNFVKINKIQKKENEALLSDVSVKKAEMELKKEALKMDLA